MFPSAKSRLNTWMSHKRLYPSWSCSLLRAAMLFLAASRGVETHLLESSPTSDHFAVCHVLYHWLYADTFSPRISVAVSPLFLCHDRYAFCTALSTVCIIPSSKYLPSSVDFLNRFENRRSVVSSKSKFPIRPMRSTYPCLYAECFAVRSIARSAFVMLELS